MTQRALLDPPPRVARILVFDLVVGGNPSRGLGRLRDGFDPDHGVVGLGLPAVLALGKNVPGLRAFPALAGPGITVPSTQGALWAFVRADDSSDAYDRAMELHGLVSNDFALREEIAGFRYRDGRDLSGYLDGTANPEGQAAIAAAIVSGKGAGLDGSSFVAGQRWRHDLKKLESLSQAERDNVVGRRIVDNEEMSDAPESAHVKRTEQEAFENPSGFVLRRSMPWGGVGKRGLYSVAYGESLDRYERALRRMLGHDDGIVDKLFTFTRAVSGGYYWCPPLREERIDLSFVGA